VRGVKKINVTSEGTGGKGSRLCSKGFRYVRIARRVSQTWDCAQLYRGVRRKATAVVGEIINIKAVVRVKGGVTEAHWLRTGIGTWFVLCRRSGER